MAENDFATETQRQRIITTTSELSYSDGLCVSESPWQIYVLLERRAHYFSQTFRLTPRALAHFFTLALLDHKQRVIDYFD